ncbi:hypothetical protein PG987_012926 [Apiospora arundinis]
MVFPSPPVPSSPGHLADLADLPPGFCSGAAKGAEEAFPRCKEKKKKCDERRPQCARCAERDLNCTYEAVKPRQRKRRDSAHTLNGASPTTSDFPGNEYDQWSPTDDIEEIAKTEHTEDNSVEDVVLSPLGSTSSDMSGKLCVLAAEFQPGGGDYESSLLTAGFGHDSPVPDSFADYGDMHSSLLRVFGSPKPTSSDEPLLQCPLPLDRFPGRVRQPVPTTCASAFSWQCTCDERHIRSCKRTSQYRGVNTGEKSIYFHNEAIQSLAQLIEKNGKVNHKNELLASIMLLVYYEVLVQKGRSNIVDGHLKGALTIMNSCQGGVKPYEYLLRTRTAPLSTAPAAGCLLPFPPLDAPPSSPLSNVDTLLGMATTLWPIMHRLSNLPSLKTELENAVKSHQTSKMAVLRTEFETTSRAIEGALQQWQPTLPSNVGIAGGLLESLDGEPIAEQPLLQSILDNALAYRHSAFVYLYRTIYGHPPTHALVQKHAHASLVHCARNVAFRGPMGALLWPLFVAACEAVAPEDRALAERAFVEVDNHQGMTNIEKAWGVVREVWKQLDLLSVTPYGAKDADLWRRVSKEMGVSIVFG